MTLPLLFLSTYTDSSKLLNCLHTAFCPGFSIVNACKQLTKQLTKTFGLKRPALKYLCVYCCTSEIPIFLLLSHKITTQRNYYLGNTIHSRLLRTILCTKYAMSVLQLSIPLMQVLDWTKLSEIPLRFTGLRIISMQEPIAMQKFVT